MSPNVDEVKSSSLDSSSKLSFFPVINGLQKIALYEARNVSCNSATLLGCLLRKLYCMIVLLYSLWKNQDIAFKMLDYLIHGC